MLVATPGQTTAYSTLHNSNTGSGGGGGSGVGSNNTNTTVTNKKTITTSLNSTTAAASSSGAPKTQNNKNHTTSSTGINKNLLNSNTQATNYNSYQQNSSKNDNNACTTKHSNLSINNSNKTTTETTSRDKITSTIANHSLKNEKSTTITTNSSSKQSFIQTLKDSVQKALISTTGNNSIINNKTNYNCNNVTATSIQSVTSSSTTTTSLTHIASKVSTTTTSENSSNSTSTAATQSSSSSLSSVRSKYFSCSLAKLHTVAPTIIHRFPEERQDASSTDSLQKEMCHFKPIRVAPTTPWKSGSKSRGNNSLRFPKANLATKPTEFILKSNCDVNNKKRKQQQIRNQVNKVGGDDDRNEQENKEYYGIYKPKPSLTSLSTTFNTPNHQSAFVCLVAQMKNLVNIQSKKLMNSTKSSRTVDLASNMEATKPKATRSMRTITAATSTTISDSTPIDKVVKELFVRQKQKPAKKLVPSKKTGVAKELPKARSTRLASSAVKNKSISTTATTIKNKSKETIKRTNAKTNEISKLSKVSIAKAKSRKNIGRAKSRMINIVALANSSIKAKEKLLKSKSDHVVAAYSIEPKNTRKRKLTAEMHTEAIATSSSPLPPLNTSSVKSLSKARKSSRASNLKQQTDVNQKQTANIPLKKLRKNATTSVACFSPPLTRSRLKTLEAQGKTLTTATTDTKKRRI